MNHLNYKEKLKMLHGSGLTVLQIRRLERFYREYAANEVDQASPNLHRLEFARWLVTNHRLTEQVDLNGNVSE
jgi:hypothetical protein